MIDDPNPSRRPVLGRPPVDAPDDELDEWIDLFLDQMLGPEEVDQHRDKTDSRSVRESLTVEEAPPTTKTHQD